jgi:hypothetical protein
MPILYAPRTVPAQPAWTHTPEGRKDLIWTPTHYRLKINKKMPDKVLMPLAEAGIDETFVKKYVYPIGQHIWYQARRAMKQTCGYETASDVDKLSIMAKCLEGIASMSRFIESNPWNQFLIIADLDDQWNPVMLFREMDDIIPNIERVIYDARVIFEIYVHTFSYLTGPATSFINMVVPGLDLTSRSRVGIGTGVIMSNLTWETFRASTFDIRDSDNILDKNTAKTPAARKIAKISVKCGNKTLTVIGK